MNFKPTPTKEEWRTFLLKSRKVDSQGCWNWPYGANGEGYGMLRRAHKRFYIHRIAAQIFLNFKPAKNLQVCHRCDNPPCFNPAHLFIGDQKANIADMLKKRRGLVGEKNGHAKLNQRQVILIKKGLANGIKGRALAARFGVNENTIYHIKHGRTWL